MKTIEATELFRQEYTLVDVRSESEYLESHIPGAVNIPILTDVSRKEVGIIYKQFGKEAAIERGLTLTTPFLVDIVRRFNALQGTLVLYCARGGMRSKSIYRLLRALSDQPIVLLEGGYKAYRQQVILGWPSLLDQKQFIVLQGNTGVGKSAILRSLQEQGEGVLNLEELAGNAGSVFGQIPYAAGQPSQKQFENNLYHALNHLPAKIYLESENRRIGNLNQPLELFEKIQVSAHILVETSLENRVEVIRRDYLQSVRDNDSALRRSIRQLNKRLSNKVVEQLFALLDAKQYDDIIRYLMVHYYDPLYKGFIDHYRGTFECVIHYEKLEEAIEQIRNCKL